MNSVHVPNPLSLCNAGQPSGYAPPGPAGGVHEQIMAALLRELAAVAPLDRSPAAVGTAPVMPRPC